jgi:hypothetical protein
MKLGFTGTRNGLTKEQRAVVRKLLSVLDFNEIHHGDCVGADNELVDLAGSSWHIKETERLGVENKNNWYTTVLPVIAYPGKNVAGNSDSRAYSRWNTKTLRTERYLTRNRNIVNNVDFVIAAPKEESQVCSGGTWYTINYAIKQKVPLIIVYSNGKVDIQNGSGIQEEMVRSLTEREV